MYLQIIYQCEALQVLKTIKQKGFQLACKQAKYGFTKVSHIAIPNEGNACTDKSEATATVHFL